MSVEQLLSMAWRRRLMFLATFVVCVAGVVLITLSLPKTYKATSTLFVGSPKESSAYLDTTLITQRVRTYATLAANPNTAQRVVQAMPSLGLTRTKLLNRMGFAPIEQTQLLQISATARTPAEAARIANGYARVFQDEMHQLFVSGHAPTPIAVAEPAALPSKPAKPNPPLYIALGTLLAVFLAFGAAALRERLDTRVRVSVADTAVLGQPVVARVPVFDPKARRLARGVSDRFELLKTNLDFLGEGPTRVVAVTSSSMGEGKSTIAANLALAAARDGERVVVIEADLRRPGLRDTAIGEAVEPSPVGLSNYLAGAASEEQILTTDPHHDNLSVIWSGLTPPNPTALLSSHRLETLLASLRLDFDRVIVDTCPISVGADASVIATNVDGTLFVVDERKTKRAEAQTGLNQLSSVRARVLGVTLNRSEVGNANGYYDETTERPRRGLRRAPAPEPETLA